jgi:hypothetical protein
MGAALLTTVWPAHAFFPVAAGWAIACVVGIVALVRRPRRALGEALLVLISGLLSATACILWSLENTPVEQAPRPYHRDVAVLIAMGEGSDPPYGDKLVVHSTINPLSKYRPEVLFVGDCAAPRNVQWRTASELLLRCRTLSRVRVQERSGAGFSVTYEPMGQQ